MEIFGFYIWIFLVGSVLKANTKPKGGCGAN
ncbi:hypothetical protein CIPAW_05G162100 [Carya illinoinensis]|uniref:Uncharacterized protein n=1 Tax=Carya illinoinensis TaxID=32201 RepID=A0A8T1QIU2_CARIL|nr:hypothetical protein CIPAW_05G162100 [Carya illinoinensis]